MEDLRRKMLDNILENDEIELTPDQETALGEFIRFCREEDNRAVFLLTGSAGTGKTFLIRIFSRFLRASGYNVVLLSPTGRAAKVVSKRTHRLAYTIHHHIFNVQDAGTGKIFFDLKQNKEPDRTVYIVDEASMVGDGFEDGSSMGLLSSLVRYIFDDDIDRKLILVGDPVQLPPVGYDESPALQKDYLFYSLDLFVYHAHLDDVKRQKLDSGILENAVKLRDLYSENVHSLSEVQGLRAYRDVQPIENPYESLEMYLGYYREGDLDRVVFISYSNYRAMKINQAIRHQLHHTSQLLIPSDLVMVVKNNYAWSTSKDMPFIANGEMGTVRQVFEDTYEEKYGLKWVNAEIEFYDNKENIILIDCKLVLDLLERKNSQLEREWLYHVYEARRQEYMGLSNSKMKTQLRSDPYVNALQIKYGYAITGHKSQGGQWETALISFEPDYGNNPQAYLRWVYTVFTRASERLYLLDCPFLD